MDLRLRHEGEILGLRQHGGVSLRFVDLDADVDGSSTRMRTPMSFCGTRAICAPWRPCRCGMRSFRYGDVFKGG